MLIFAGGTRLDGFLAQARIDSFTLQVGEFLQPGLRLGTGGENALDRGQGESAEADGTLEGGAYVVALVVSDQGQELLSLQLALRLPGEQAVKELHGDRAEFSKTLPQKLLTLAGIGDRMMALERLTHPCHGAGHQRMAGDFFQVDGVDDDFTLRDAHGQHLADVREGNTVKVEPVRDITLDVDVAIEELGGVEVAGRQGQQVRLFALMTLQRRFLEVTQDAHVGDAPQPAGGHLVEMLQGVEGATIEQVGFDIEELALDLALGLWAAHAAGLRTEAVVGGEGEELGVV